MIIPSIDLMGGSTVQLVGGREKKLDAGPPLPIARKFALAGEIAVIDLDAALGTGDNRERTDTRVLQAIYRAKETPGQWFVGQQVDVYIAAGEEGT